MKVDVFLSTRNKASRLPGKVLMKLQGRTVTEHLIDRLKLARNISQIILCTSTNSNDDILVEMAKANNIEYFRGSEEDKLQRYLGAAKVFGTDFITVADGDDIFCEPSFIDSCIGAFRKTKVDYISIKNAPIGTIPFCVSFGALQRVCQLKNETNTELWTSCFTETGLFHYLLLDPPARLRRPEVRLTLDYEEDFALLERIFANLYKAGKVMSLEEVLEFLGQNLDLLNINKHMQEHFLQNQRKLPRVTLKQNSSQGGVHFDKSSGNI